MSLTAPPSTAMSSALSAPHFFTCVLSWVLHHRKSRIMCVCVSLCVCCTRAVPTHAPSTCAAGTAHTTTGHPHLLGHPHPSGHRTPRPPVCPNSTCPPGPPRSIPRPARAAPSGSRPRAPKSRRAAPARPFRASAPSCTHRRRHGRAAAAR